MAGLPSFGTLLKSREVEDPVNVWVHRPLAYGFVKLIWRTSITPNQVTLLAMGLGIVAGLCFLQGSAPAMVAGGLLLWSSAILDGADGILARAKQQQSQFGRALDGSADMVVAIATVLPIFAHLWMTHHDPVHLALMVPTIALTVVHLYIYDYYKESYLRATRLDRGGEGADPGDVAKLVAPAREKGRITYLAVRYVLLPFVTAQTKLVARFNPRALREGRGQERSPETAAIYRQYNGGPMALWAIISLAPHSYLLSMFAMADRADLYLWVRLVAMNVVFVVALVWQRRATRRMQEALADRSSAPDGLVTA